MRVLLVEGTATKPTRPDVGRLIDIPTSLPPRVSVHPTGDLDAAAPAEAAVYEFVRFATNVEMQNAWFEAVYRRCRH